MRNQEITAVCAGILFVISLYQVIGQQEILPFLEKIPKTSFTCRNRIYGYYADQEANCQVFHICLNSRKWSFLCPNQTKFNQDLLVCDYPDGVDCDIAEERYKINENFGKIDSKLS
uniref:Chitin-binding type-2 domain-containing protein n=1 Tax=Strigamia maritima TaxID=126957 RepID=T1J0R3_STRMM